MFDWKELFPAEAIAPFIGGILLWFGFNYVFLAPQVLSPRLAEKYYFPACHAALADYKTRAAQEWETRLSDQEAQLQQRGLDVRARINDYLNSLGNSPQAQLARMMMARAAENDIATAVGELRNEFRIANQSARDERTRGNNHKTAAAYCGCVVNTVLDSRFDLAAFTSSLRLYTPTNVARLQSGAAIFDTPACGSAPIA